MPGRKEREPTLEPRRGDGLERLATAMYLFGSAARGEADELSDVDVAVLLAEEGEFRRDPVGVLALLREAAALRLGADPGLIDPLILNFAPPLVAYEAIREGRLIYCADDERRTDFEDDLMRRALDLIPEMRLFHAEVREAILEGAFQDG